MNTFKLRFPPLPGVWRGVLCVALAGSFWIAGGRAGGAPGLLALLQARPAWAETAPAAPQGDGLQLLEKHCLNCHVIEKISRYRKAREQWEQTISNMISGYGVVLTEAEKAVVLDYLVSLKKPAAKAP